LAASRRLYIEHACILEVVAVDVSSIVDTNKDVVEWQTMPGRDKVAYNISETRTETHLDPIPHPMDGTDTGRGWLANASNPSCEAQDSEEALIRPAPAAERAGQRIPQLTFLPSPSPRILNCRDSRARAGIEMLIASRFQRPGVAWLQANTVVDKVHDAGGNEERWSRRILAMAASRPRTRTVHVHLGMRLPRPSLQRFEMRHARRRTFARWILS
jgi:hypothetical protein